MRFKQFIVMGIVVTFLGTGLVMPAQAAVISTQGYLQAEARQLDLAAVEQALLREDVRQQLTGLGVDLDQAQARVARLTDQELARLAEEMQTLPAGGDILGVIGIVFVVLLILELVGVTDIFKAV